MNILWIERFTSDTEKRKAWKVHAWMRPVFVIGLSYFFNCSARPLKPKKIHCSLWAEYKNFLPLRQHYNDYIGFKHYICVLACFLIYKTMTWSQLWNMPLLLLECQSYEKNASIYFIIVSRAFFWACSSYWMIWSHVSAIEGQKMHPLSCCLWRNPSE